MLVLNQEQRNTAKLEEEMMMDKRDFLQEIARWTSYGMIEGKQSFEKAFKEAYEYTAEALEVDFPIKHGDKIYIKMLATEEVQRWEREDKGQW